MNIVILSSTEEIAKAAADLYTNLLADKPNAVLGLATGSSPVPVYDELIRRYEAEEVSFKDATAFLLDEYVGLPKGHPESYAEFIKRVFVSKVDFSDGAVNGPDGNASNPKKAADEYEEKIVASGGVDLQILGIGTDGHIAFNEPGGSLASTTHTQVLTEQTRVDNARFFDGDINQVPRFCLTQGLATIGRAKSVVLVAQGEQKADAVAALVEGGVSALWPASVLQFHNDATILVDEAAASKLKLKDYYRAAYEGEQALSALED
ncbi:glucosamine-6-phosphate deaminase [Actinomyces minihominis]|uniref:glucosamine-6-phosphate deaminase n=1 Tax=Actinomyces minihominis TaxID=2002838 RepID=UPI000C089D78|nr:glucosamine-6-phosphate deaminase [Actinomyces minihominis]